jgi:hypothetical protein
MQSAACVPAFILGMLLGDYILPLMGVPRSMVYSAVLGVFAAVVTFAALGRIYKRKSVPAPAAYEIAS